jgi:hypothetical protein
MDHGYQWLAQKSEPLNRFIQGRKNFSPAAANLLENGNIQDLWDAISRNPEVVLGIGLSGIPQVATYLYSGPVGSTALMVGSEMGALEQDALAHRRRTGQRMPTRDFRMMSMRVPVSVFLERMGLKTIKAGGVLGEVATEQLQTGVENLSVKLFSDPNRSITDGMIESGIAAVGAGTAGARLHRHRVDQKVTQKLSVEHTFNGHFLGRDGAYRSNMPITQVPGVLPNNGMSAHQRIYFVNGVAADVATHRAHLQSLANTGAEVVGIHDSTVNLASDVAQAARYKAYPDETPAVNTTRQVIETHLAEGKPLHLAGHSRGALVVARALEVTQMKLLETHSPAEVAQRMSSITVETYGGASKEFPKGPRYYHFVNKVDAIPLSFGVGGPLAGKGKPGHHQVIQFKEITGAPVETNVSDIVYQVTHPFDVTHDMGLYARHISRATIFVQLKSSSSSD